MLPSLRRPVFRKSHRVSEEGEDELTRVRAEIQRLARVRYAQRRFTDEQQAEYEALVARRNELIGTVSATPEPPPQADPVDEAP